MTDRPSLIGPFQVEGVLGRGGMGVVYRARHAETGVEVALKTIRVPAACSLSGIRREIRVLARLDHAGVVRILDEGVHDGLPWYAMEKIEGRSLREHLGLGGPASAMPDATLSQCLTAIQAAETVAAGDCLREIAVERDGQPGDRPAEGQTSRSQGASPEECRDMRPALAVIQRLCCTLDYLHGEGVVHRDLKPDNVLVRAGDVPVLVDFGVISRFSAGSSRESLQLGGTLVGTARYMAPEQVRGEIVDARADLYAVGCILYELVTGGPPFDGDTPQRILLQQLSEAPPPPSRVSPGVAPELERLIMRLLAKAPEERVGHADDVARALAEMAGEDGWPAEGRRGSTYLYRPRFAGREAARLKVEAVRRQLVDGSGGLVLVGGESGVGKTRFAAEVAREMRQCHVRVLLGECLPPTDSELGASCGAAGEPLHPLRSPLVNIADLCREGGQELTGRLFGRRAKVLMRYEPCLSGLPGVEAFADPAPLPAEPGRRRVLTYLTETIAALAGLGPLLLVLDDLQWADDLTLAWLRSLAGLGWLKRTRVAVLGTYRTEEVGATFRSVATAVGTTSIVLDRLNREAVERIVGDMLAVSPPPVALSHFLTEHGEGNPFFVAEYLRTAISEGVLKRNASGRWRLAGPQAEQKLESRSVGLGIPVSLRALVARRLDGLPKSAKRLLEIACVVGREALEEASQLRNNTLRGAGLRAMATIHYRMGNLAEARKLGQRALSAYRQCGERTAEGVTLTHLAVVACTQGSLEEALSRSSQALEIHRTGLERSALGEALAVTSVACRDLGRLNEARRMGEEALGIHREMGDSRRQGIALSNLGLVWRQQGRLKEAARLCLAGIEIHREVGEQRWEGMAQSTLALVRHDQGRWEEADQLFEEAIQLMVGCGERRWSGVTMANRALLWRDMGRMEEAGSLGGRALEQLGEPGDSHWKWVATSGLAAVLSASGRFEEARQVFDGCVPRLRRLGTGWYLCEAVREAAANERRSGVPSRAWGVWVVESEALSREMGNPLMLVMCLCERVHLLRAKEEETDAVLEEIGGLSVGGVVGERSPAGLALRELGLLQGSERAGPIDPNAQTPPDHHPRAPKRARPPIPARRTTTIPQQGT